MSYKASYRRILHRMGYYNYQRGLIYHHLDEEGSWNDHLKNCREFILRSVNLLKPEVVTILGSGWLLDVPLRELNEIARKIYLVDIVHPPEVREQIHDFRKVDLREEDITGGLIEEVWKNAGHRTVFNKLKSLDEIKVMEYIPDYDPGMVISVNILTQLETLPLRLLRKKSKAGEESLKNFRRMVQEKHMTFLNKHSSIVITDSSELVSDSSGLVREIPSLLVELPETGQCEEWTWNFDFKKSDFYTLKSVYKVKAIFIRY